MKLNCSCNNEIKKVEVWFLKDIADFEARKIIFGKCPKCRRPVVTIIEKRIIDGEVFIKENITGNEAMRVLNRETKRMLCKYYKVDVNSLNGWVYGINTEIKNKKGEVTQIRQYASDFNKNKVLIKKIKG